MFSNASIGLLHTLVSYLLQPVIWLLMALAVLAVLEMGSLITERWFALRRLRVAGEQGGEATLIAIESLALKRIERADFLARISPMLGLMGTLIPLGPGLAALGSGDISVLTVAMTVAFDTTVLGLLVGIVGFVAARLRRRWYDELLQSLEPYAAAGSVADRQTIQ